MLYLIEFLHQTTTQQEDARLRQSLYLIEFLHQTTTQDRIDHSYPKLYLIEFLHQTTTDVQYGQIIDGCILLNFYIKPQQESSQ